MTYGLAHQEISAVLILEDPRAIEIKARRAKVGRFEFSMNMNGDTVKESPNDAKENIFKRRKVVDSGPWYVLLIEGSNFFASAKVYGVDVKCRCRVRRFRWMEVISRHLEVKMR